MLDNFTRGRRENLENAMAHRPMTLINGDIRDRDVLANAAEGVDTIFHLAAIRITQCAEEPRLALEVLADGTFNVLEAAVQIECSKSSGIIIGLRLWTRRRVSHHRAAASLQQSHTLRRGKKFSTRTLAQLNDMYGLPYIALRYFNVYGPRMDVYGVYTEVLIRWMQQIKQGLPPLIFGDGQQTMDFVHVADIARANILAAESDVSDETFNVASGVETSLNDLAYALLKVMKSDLKPEYAAERKVNPVQRRLADTSRAKKQIGFEAEISLEDGLQGLVGWWQSQSTEAANV